MPETWIQTDLQEWKQFLTKFGVGFTEMESTSKRALDNTPLTPSIILRLRAKDDENVKGYVDFYTDIYFTPEGKFIEIGIWE